jgi:hypothetical protein
MATAKNQPRPQLPIKQLPSSLPPETTRGAATAIGLQQASSSIRRSSFLDVDRSAP